MFPAPNIGHYCPVVNRKFSRWRGSCWTDLLKPSGFNLQTESTTSHVDTGIRVVFLQRLVRHILPDRFKKIRHAGLYAAPKALAKARAALGPPRPPKNLHPPGPRPCSCSPEETWPTARPVVPSSSTKSFRAIFPAPGGSADRVFGTRRDAPGLVRTQASLPCNGKEDRGLPRAPKCGVQTLLGLAKPRGKGLFEAIAAQRSIFHQGLPDPS